MQFYRESKSILFMLFLLAIIGGVIWFASYPEEVSLPAIRELAESFGPWLPISFMLIYIVATIFFPTTPLMLLAGVIFGFKWGLIYTTLAGFISALVTFYISRLLGKDFVDKLLSARVLSRLEKWNGRIAARGLLTVTVLRMIPIMPFNVLNLIMGISKVNTRDYALGTVIGLVPSNAITVYLGILITSILL